MAVHDWATTLNNHGQVDAIMFDFRKAKKFWGGGGPNLAERAKSRGYGKFLKFMHQILKTRLLTYIPPVQGYCLTIKNLGSMQITQISVATYS